MSEEGISNPIRSWTYRLCKFTMHLLTWMYDNWDNAFVWFIDTEYEVVFTFYARLPRRDVGYVEDQGLFWGTNTTSGALAVVWFSILVHSVLS